MISFDVRNLFTKIPIQEAVEVVNDRLLNDSTLSDRTDLPPSVIVGLLKKCLTTTYFQLEGTFYEQTEGAAMWSPLSTVIANLFMEFFEDLAINTSSVQPSLWLPYVDYTFVIWTHWDQHLHSFRNHLNSTRPSIHFTMEEESEGSIPFLDVLFRRIEQQLETSVYRKATHTDSYIHYVSNHHPATKIGIITCLKKRAISVCKGCLLYTSPSPRDRQKSRMPSSA